MKSRKNLLWSEEDNQRLKDLVGAGISPSRAAVMFKRTVNSVQNQARLIGTPFPPLHAVKRALKARIEAAAERELYSRLEPAQFRYPQPSRRDGG